jgi:hypothetical protein
MVGCQDKEAMAELEAMKAQAEIEEQNKALIRNGIEEMNKKNYEILRDIYAPSAKIYLPSNSSEPISIEQSIQMVKSFHTAFPDFCSSIEELIAVDDKVIVRVIDGGTHEGEILGIPATRKKDFILLLIPD